MGVFKQLPTDHKYRVWIELDRPQLPTDGKLRAELANKMLKRLGVDYDVFWWHDKNSCYCVNLGPGGAGYLECSDNGHWFDLEWLSEKT